MKSTISNCLFQYVENLKNHLIFKLFNSPYPTPVPSDPLTQYFNTGVDSAVKAAGAIIGTLIIVIIILFIVGGLILIFRFFNKLNVRNNKRQLAVQVVRLVDSNWIEDPDILVSLQTAFVNNKKRLDQDLALIRGRIDFRSELPRYYLRLQEKYFSFNSLTDAAGINWDELSQLGSPLTEEFKLKFSMGPIEVQSDKLMNLVNKLLSRKIYQLTINIQDDYVKKGRILLTLMLIIDDKHIYSKSFSVIKSNLISKVEDVANEITLILNSIDSVKYSKYGNVEDLPEFNMIQGIHMLAEFMRNPRDGNLLFQAQSYFDNASIDNDWSFKAEVLSAVSQMLTKKNALETSIKFKKIENKYSKDKAKNRLLAYYVGQSIFYQYNKSEYPNAISSFQRVTPPFKLIWNSSNKLWVKCIENANSSILEEYILFCLSRCGIAIIKAHQIKRETDSSEEQEINKRLRDDVNSIIMDVREELEKIKKIPDEARSEVEWRLYNAEIMVSLRMREDLNKGKKAADQALRVAPYALDVKANYGSLELMSAAFKIDTGEDPTKINELQEAEKIFLDLEHLAWDLGFVYYRIGMIKRVQGEYEAALTYFYLAMDPKIKNVPDYRLESQILKSKSKDQSLIPAEVY